MRLNFNGTTIAGSVILLLACFQHFAFSALHVSIKKAKVLDGRFELYLPV